MMNYKYVEKVLATVLCCYLAMRGVTGRVVVCQEPSTETLHNQYQDWLGIEPHESFNLLPQMEAHVKTLVHNDTDAERETRIAGNDEECDTLSFGEVYQRSTCPYHYVSLENTHMFPTKVVSARCNSCSGCVGVASADYGCFPIPYYAKVLIRDECVNGVYQYRPAYEKLTVGCVCAQKPPGTAIVS